MQWNREYESWASLNLRATCEEKRHHNGWARKLNDLQSHSAYLITVAAQINYNSCYSSLLCDSSHYN